MAEVALALLAHPDDAEFLCAGTLVRLAREHGWRIHIASMTAGDCGSAEHSSEEISRIRREEGASSAALIKGEFHCLEERDLLVVYDGPTLIKATALLRRLRPRIIFTHSPDDYHLDHEMTARVARAASFAAPVPLFARESGDPPPLERIPHLYYCDPLEGKDALGRTVSPGFHIDISSSIDAKSAMLTCHKSQRNWLLHHHGIDEYVESMRTWSASRGRGCGVDFAEGFRQHLGHSYPQDNQLGTLLGAV
jgi:LmbE family N-acetylglucosaminyl deacetylase